MKVCIVVRAMPWHRLGGLEFHALDLCRGLLSAGCDVTVITTPAPAGVSPDQTAELRVIEVPDVNPGNYSIGFFRKVSEVVAQAHREFVFDVIHAQEMAGLFFLPPRGVPLVVTVHGTLFSETELDRRVRSHLSIIQRLKALWRYKHRLGLIWAFNGMLSRSDRLLVDSEFSFRELLYHDLTIREKTNIVSLGLDLRRYPQIRDGGEVHRESGLLRIALLGRVQEAKGLGIVIEVARMCTARQLPLLFNIGGTGDYLETVRLKIQKYGLQDMVVLHGRIDQADLPGFLSDNDLFLFPDLTHPAFGLVALEAMRYGLPVIGTTNGAISETVTEDVGWTYRAWEVDELVQLLEGLVQKTGVVREKGSAALAKSIQRTAEQMARDTVDVYHQAAKRA